jgi:hypothetical protein
VSVYSTPPDDRAIVFLHNHRCAGNALTYILSEEFGPDAVFRYGMLGDRFQDFGAFLAAAKDRRHRFFVGHFCFGVHRHIDRPVAYLTNIRDPQDRVVSLYMALAERPSFRDWVKSDFDAGNGMVKRLCGFGRKEGTRELHDFTTDRPLPPGFEVDESHLAQALATVETWPVRIVAQDMMVESLRLLQRDLGCRPLFSLSRQHFNQSLPARPSRELAEEIEAANRLDRILHRELHARLAAEIAAQDKDFHDDVLAIRMLDAIARLPRKHTVDFDAFLERLDVAVRRLLADQRKDELAHLVEIILTKPDLPPDFWVKCIRLMREINRPAKAEALRDAFHARFGVAAPE